jgi:hypothetical protein
MEGVKRPQEFVHVGGVAYWDGDSPLADLDTKVRGKQK